MTLPTRYIAPAGTPISAGSLLGAGLDHLLGCDTQTRLSAAICGHYGVKHCLLLSSGRAALTLIMRTLKRLQGDVRRDEIVIPGYTCYSVASAAILAGLRIRIVDIDPHTLSYARDELERCDFSRVIAIISSNLYGLTNELTFLEQIAKDRGVFMIDDAAQSMHARYAGRPAGTFGDLGIYSFDKGKNITSLQGGAIVTDNNEIATALSEEIAKLPGERIAATAASYIKLAAYSVFLNPALYWIPAGIPALGLGKTLFTTDIPMHRMSTMAAGLAARLFNRIDTITKGRVDTARRLDAAIDGSTILRPIEPVSSCQPVYLRFPCLAREQLMRDRLVTRLNECGIGATASFPKALCDLEDIREFVAGDAGSQAGAREVASRIITLPTLPYVTKADVKRLADCIMSSGS